ncbi:MAG: hypothetical protein JXQ89_09310 [Pelagimonas sp.]
MAHIMSDPELQRHTIFEWNRKLSVNRSQIKIFDLSEGKTARVQIVPPREFELVSMSNRSTDPARPVSA